MKLAFGNTKSGAWRTLFEIDLDPCLKIQPYGLIANGTRHLNATRPKNLSPATEVQESFARCHDHQRGLAAWGTCHVAVDITIRKGYPNHRT